MFGFVTLEAFAPERRAGPHEDTHANDSVPSSTALRRHAPGNARLADLEWERYD